MRGGIAEGTKTSAPAKRRPEPASASTNGVLLRAAVPGDAERLGRMFSRCSRETVWLRFHLPFPRVPQAMLGRLVDVDPVCGRALVAESGDEVVGHAMYAKEEGGDREAEVALVVEDGWSSKGVGRLLLAGIAGEAGRDGVEALTCTTVGENRRVREVARCSFPGASISFSRGECHVRLPLGRSADGAWNGGAASAGEIFENVQD